MVPFGKFVIKKKNNTNFCCCVRKGMKKERINQVFCFTIKLIVIARYIVMNAICRLNALHIT